MKNIIDWLKNSHRLLHLVLGAVYGLFACGWYCALYGGMGVSGALEFKDHQWGGKPDWVDFILTLAGVMAGYGLRILIFKLFGL